MPSAMGGQRPALSRPLLRLGQADPLPGVAWSLWTHHIQATGPSWLYPVVCLGHLLCLRVTHVLRLRGKDFDLEHGVVRLQLFTGQATLEKLMSEAAIDFVHKLQVKGISVKRLKKSGSRGVQEVTDVWNWPEGPEEYLFPPSRRDSRSVRRSKDAVSKAIRRARQTFQVPHIPEVQPNRIRSNSGRSRCINDMKEHNVERQVGKKYARITDGYEKHNKFSVRQAGKRLRQNQELQAYWKKMY